MNLGDLPAGLRAYLVAVIVAGPLLAIGLLATSPPDPTGRQLLLAALLTSVAAVADRFRFHLTYKTNVDVATVAYLAMIFALPAPAPGVLTVVAVGAGELLRRHSRRMDGAEVGFNLGQMAVAVTAAALAHGGVQTAVRRLADQPGDLDLILPAVTASVTLWLANTGLVAAAAGLHMGISPRRIWRESLHQAIPSHAAMTALAGVSMLLARDHPLLLPTLVVPAVLVHRAIRASVQLRADTHAALDALVEVVELRDPYTAGHSRRVATTARRLALRLGLTAEEADTIESAGRVHDVGKVAIDPAVLAHPGKLNEAQWAEMRRHPVLGADVIAHFAAYGDGHRLVRHHHEGWDGSGYPDGLAGEAIPLGARILAVADTFDALTSDRPYRRGMGVASALAILADGAGHQWDPGIVEALVQQLATAARESTLPPQHAVPPGRRPVGARGRSRWPRRLRVHSAGTG